MRDVSARVPGYGAIKQMERGICTIAHRMSTIRQCNRIIVLAGGKVAEDGSYDELLAKGGFFSEIIKRQTV